MQKNDEVSEGQKYNEMLVMLTDRGEWRCWLDGLNENQRELGEGLKSEKSAKYIYYQKKTTFLYIFY